MCRLSWLRGRGCSTPVMLARPTRWTRPRWPQSRCTTRGFAWCAPRVIAWVCGCCLTVGMIWLKSGPGPLIARPPSHQGDLVRALIALTAG
jgi:hypothetical protein